MWSVFRSLWPSYTIWWHKSGSALAQVTVCCLITRTNIDFSLVRLCGQYWLLISEVMWCSPVLLCIVSLKIILSKQLPHLPRASQSVSSKCDLFPTFFAFMQDHINGLVQDCSNSIANALELVQSCAKSLISYTGLYILHWDMTTL